MWQSNYTYDIRAGSIHWEFKAHEQVCNERLVLLGRNVVRARIAGASREPPMDYDEVKVTKMGTKLMDDGQARYIAALHFDKLNHMTNGNIK